MATPKILVVLTSHDKIDKIGKQTGWYLPEFSHPHEVLSAKAEIVTASPKGGHAPLDQGSLEAFKDDPYSKIFLETQKSLWENTQPLSSFVGRSSEFAAIFYPGGHGPMYDLAHDKDSIALIKEFYAAGKPVAAVCHGPAAFVNVEIDGKPLVSGKNITAFSDAEEDTVGLTDAMPFLLETELVKQGAKFTKAEEQFKPKVVTDGLIITGQNPASGKGIGEALAAALKL